MHVILLHPRMHGSDTFRSCVLCTLTYPRTGVGPNAPSPPCTTRTPDGWLMAGRTGSAGAFAVIPAYVWDASICGGDAYVDLESFQFYIYVIPPTIMCHKTRKHPAINSSAGMIILSVVDLT